MLGLVGMYGIWVFDAGGLATSNKTDAGDGGRCSCLLTKKAGGDFTLVHAVTGVWRRWLQDGETWSIWVFFGVYGAGADAMVDSVEEGIMFTMRLFPRQEEYCIDARNASRQCEQATMECAVFKLAHSIPTDPFGRYPSASRP